MDTGKKGELDTPVNRSEKQSRRQEDGPPRSSLLKLESGTPFLPLPAVLQAGAQTGIDKGDTEPCGEALVRHKAATAGQQQVR
jgi:hypothetical protein